jgi:hypothetical protein
MELAIQNKLNVNLGDVIYYVNNGSKASHGDVQKISKPTKAQNEEHTKKYGKPMPVDYIQINSYMLDSKELENNPEMTGEYNVPRAITTFNKRIEPLLVCFKDEVRNGLIVTDPEKRGIFTTAQCELINGQPFDESGQDKLEDVLAITDAEMSYWKKRGLDPDYMYELAEEGWKEKLGILETV